MKLGKQFSKLPNILIILVLLFTYSFQAHAETQKSTNLTVCTECQESTDSEICRNIKPNTITISLPLFILIEHSHQFIKCGDTSPFEINNHQHIDQTKISNSELARSHL
jgi:hypothetical protein